MSLQEGGDRHDHRQWRVLGRVLRLERSRGLLPASRDPRVSDDPRFADHLRPSRYLSRCEKQLSRP